MNIIIVDDEPGAIAILSSMIKDQYNDLTILATSNEINDAYNKIDIHKPDLVFLDIRIGRNTCFDLLNLFDVIDFEFIIISGYNSYGIDAVKANALDYLVKPINFNELVIAIDKAIDRIDKRSSINANSITELKLLQNNRIIVSTSHSEKILLNIYDITRCIGEKNYTTFCLSNGKEIIVSRTLKEFETKLESFGFIRVFQSQLINIMYVSGISSEGGNSIRLTDGNVVPVSRDKKSYILEYITKYSV